MRIAEKIAHHRLQMLREMEEEQRRIAQGDSSSLPSEVLEAKQTIAKFEERNRKRIEEAQRLQLPPSGEEDCPRCQSHGVSIRMRPHTDEVGEFLRCRECELEIPLSD